MEERQRPWEETRNEEKRGLPCSAALDGEYGISNLFVGMAVKICAADIEKTLEAKLGREELSALRRSAAAVKEYVKIAAPKLSQAAA